MPAQTAYWGLIDVAKIKKKGETVVVSGAAGAVGLVVRTGITLCEVKSITLSEA